MSYALKAAEELDKKNVQAEVIDLRTCGRWIPRRWSIRSRETNRASWSRKAGSSPASAAEIAGAHHGAGIDYLTRRSARLRQGRADALRGETRKARAASVAQSGRRRQSCHVPMIVMYR